MHACLSVVPHIIHALIQPPKEQPLPHAALPPSLPPSRPTTMHVSSHMPMSMFQMFNNVSQLVLRPGGHHLGQNTHTGHHLTVPCKGWRVGRDFIRLPALPQVRGPCPIFALLLPGPNDMSYMSSDTPSPAFLSFCA